MSSAAVMSRWIQRTVESHTPWNVHLDLTYRCNERCVHCYLDHEDHGEMTTAEISGILHQIADAGTLFLTISGGEIFLRSDLFEILSLARRLHFDLSLKTNALLITDERAARLRELGVRAVQVSIYSADPKIHDAITNVPGSLARSLAAIRRLKQQGLRAKIACPLMKQNLTAYRSVAHLAEELGVPYVFDLTITPRMDGDMHLLALRNTAQELLPILTDFKVNPAHPSTAPVHFAAAEHSTDFDEAPCDSSGYDDIPCSAGHNSCYISPYGQVYPCVQMPVAAGNVRQRPFEEIWYRSAELQRVRAVRESLLPVCSSCEIRSYCERCPGLAQMEGGALTAAYERACELAEARARLAGIAHPVSAWRLQQGAKQVQVTNSQSQSVEIARMV